MIAFEAVRRVLPDSSKPAADPHGPMLKVVIPPGVDAAGIGDILENSGVVADGSRFRNYAKEQGEGAEFKAGSYRIRAGSDYDVIIRELDNGMVAVRIRKLLIPEGFRLTEIEDRVPSAGISKAAYRRAVDAASPPGMFGNPSSMEGFLFPATYDVTAKTTASSLVAQQRQAFTNAFQKVDMSYAASRNLTPYDVLIIASMIEREAQVPGERPLIAAVIYNRLHLGMPLGIDATLLYEQGSWSHQLTVSELAANTPYNTRLRHGLPPTPISNPGLASLQAAAHPAKVGYLYYVRKPDKQHHFFTASYQAFLDYARAHGYGG